MSAPIELVIFDCDGVLVDSEPLAMRVLLEAVAGQGVDVPPETAWRNFLGVSLQSISETLETDHGTGLDDTVLRKMRDDLFALFRRELKPMPHLATMLQRLDLPTCVASSSGPERIRLSLETTGLLPHFDGRIFSASMVSNGKPAPDLFLHAAREMGVAPENCLVIEDSPAGIRAARAAGMRVFAYLGGGHVEPAGLDAQARELGPDARFADMRMLPGLIGLHQARAAQRAPGLVAAVDVGTASARAALVDAAGHFLAYADAPFAMHRPDGTVAEHSADEIWTAVCAATREACARSGVAAGEVAGISFDATCSLVLRDADGASVTVSSTGEDRLDTIAWLDHRAQAEAVAASGIDHPARDHVGGTFSPEMQVPKLMWLKRHLPESWQRAANIFDLADFLSWRATGNPARSICTLACKWTYLPRAGGWQPDFLAAVKLDDLGARAGLPELATPVGADLGPLTPTAAAELGLTPACHVGMGLIDAHAGALGALDPVIAGSATGQLTLVGGTSSCVMALSAAPHPVPTVWGPFADAVIPDLWLNEAGQSATGALLDHMLRTHPAGGPPTRALHAAVLAGIEKLQQREGDGFAARLHLLPDFHGNRSPLGQPAALGVVSGLDLDESFDALCRLYYRAAVAIAMGLKHNLETLAANGYDTTRVHVAGGHTRNPLLMRLYADATGATLVAPDTPDATLLGVAMAAATAAGLQPDLGAAHAAMQAPATPSRRPDPARAAAHARDYAIYHEMLAHRRALEQLGAA